MTYHVEFKRSAQKQLERLPKNIQRRIADAIDGLAKNPRPHGYIQMETDDILYRIRVGDYRIIYEIIDNRLVVLVIRIGHRREVYR
jgi:mRNA interferase RelE/StbE